MRRENRILVCMLCVKFASVSAYETETHAAITQAAYQISNLNPANGSDLVTRLGFDRLDRTLPFAAYWEAAAISNFYFVDYPLDHFSDQMSAGQFERCQMQELLASINFGAAFEFTVESPSGSDGYIYPIANWLVRGAILEDDLGQIGVLLNYRTARCAYSLMQPASAASLRVEQHFYDPIFDRGLDNTRAHSFLAPGGRIQRSVDWALGYYDSFATPVPDIDIERNNHFSYSDARNNMWWALTKESGRAAPPYTTVNRQRDAGERLFRWATAFRSLGDTVHLLEDMAQPQHTRNDYHGPGSSDVVLAFEAFTNARVLSLDSTHNTFIATFFGENASPTYFKPLPSFVSVPPVTFATPSRFYSTRLKTDTSQTLPDGRYGMADYSNRGFFTGGTLPQTVGDVFQEPAVPLNSDGSLAAGYRFDTTVPCTALATADSRLRNSVTCGHFERSVPETTNVTFSTILPSGFAVPNVPLVEASVWKDPSTAQGIPSAQTPTYAMGLEDLEATADLAVPRAVGYAAGLLNFFFRGSIDVEAPEDGLIAVLDDAQPHQANIYGYPCEGSATADGCIVYGFTSVRLNIRNNTPDLIESIAGATAQKQSFASTVVDASGTNSPPDEPTILAVARYHLNPCYSPDLSGEVAYDPTGQEILPACSWRTDYQEIAVSAPLRIDASVINATSSSPQVFDFKADPIPVNATDLFIQVVYRGPLGSEIDGIAVGNLDVAEANYYTHWNNSDWFDLNGQWVTPAVAAQAIGQPAAPQPTTNVKLCFEQTHIFDAPGAGFSALTAGEFFRVAFLTTPGIHRTGVLTTFNNALLYISGSQDTSTRQANYEKSSQSGYQFQVVPIQVGRGTGLGTWWSLDYEFSPNGNFSQNVLALTPSLTQPAVPGNILAFGNTTGTFCN